MLGEFAPTPMSSNGLRRARGGRSREESRGLAILFALVVGVVLLVMAILVLLLNSYEVVDKGRLLPYTTGEIYEIELFGRFTIYAEPEAKPSLDVFNSYILVSLSSIALLALTFLRVVGVPTRPRLQAFFLVVWLGTGFLAADELLGGHESLGHNLRFLTELPGVHRPDDAIVALYAPAAVAFFVIFRRIILASMGARIGFGVAIVLVVIAAASDLVGVGQTEELVEALASMSLLAGFMLLTIDELRLAAAARPAGEQRALSPGSPTST
jgi:hypothetical protein